MVSRLAGPGRAERELTRDMDEASLRGFRQRILHRRGHLAGTLAGGEVSLRVSQQLAGPVDLPGLQPPAKRLLRERLMARLHDQQLLVHGRRRVGPTQVGVALRLELEHFRVGTLLDGFDRAQHVERVLGAIFLSQALGKHHLVCAAGAMRLVIFAADELDRTPAVRPSVHESAASLGQRSEEVVRLVSRGVEIERGVEKILRPLQSIGRETHLRQPHPQHGVGGLHLDRGTEVPLGHAVLATLKGERGRHVTPRRYLRSKLDGPFQGLGRVVAVAPLQIHLSQKHAGVGVLGVLGDEAFHADAERPERFAALLHLEESLLQMTELRVGFAERVGIRGRGTARAVRPLAAT